MMNKAADSKTNLQFLNAQFLVKRIKPNPIVLIARNSTLSKGGRAKYVLTRVELKTFIFPTESNSLSIENADLGHISKRLLFTMVKNTVFIGTLDTNPYKFQHIRFFAVSERKNFP